MRQVQRGHGFLDVVFWYGPFGIGPAEGPLSKNGKYYRKNHKNSDHYYLNNEHGNDGAYRQHYGHCGSFNTDAVTVKR